MQNRWPVILSSASACVNVCALAAFGVWLVFGAPPGARPVMGAVLVLTAALMIAAAVAGSRGRQRQ